MIRIISFFLLLVWAPAFADGTILFDPDIKKILEQRPFFANTLYDIFDFDSNAVATRIGNGASTKLDGARIGPYRIKVKKKGSTGDFDRQLVINTAITFLNSNGKETEDPKQAASVKEEFIAVEIEPLKK